MNQTLYLLEFQDLIGSLPSEFREKFLQLYVARIKNPVLAVGLTAFLGFLGINRFYVGEPLLGVLKLMVFLFGASLDLLNGLFPGDPFLNLFSVAILSFVGFWTTAEIFLIGNQTRQKNLEIARGIRASFANTTIWHQG